MKVPLQQPLPAPKNILLRHHSCYIVKHIQLNVAINLQNEVFVRLKAADSIVEMD
jgi:hypothetical protein